MASESPGHETEAKEPILRLSPFNWGGFAESFFLTVATGAIATGIAVANPELLPGWMIRSVPLQVLSVFFIGLFTSGGKAIVQLTMKPGSEPLPAPEPKGA